ncbi:MAG: hypothetical protein CM15mP85_04220 [Rhodobacterales bacterium]|nr:MAG: hypothetical protein CM15mP85_04220 [Rhodobacterales bacterium]
MQTSFQEYSILGKSRPLVLNSPSTNDVRNTYLQPNQTSEINQADRLVGENYNLKRLHSPYLSPSHLAVEQIVLSQNIAPFSSITLREPNIFLYLSLQALVITTKLIFTPDPLYQMD